MAQLQTNIVKKPSIEIQRKKDSEMVRGVFKFYEVPGGSMSFSYRKYKEEPIKRYDMIDGQIYTIPRGVAKHLNNNCWYPEYDFIKGEDARTAYAIKNKVHRCGFQSLEFMDESDSEEQIIVEVATKQTVAV